jgi:putative toxin-antitoxin system antitoxin component (TIGR02293 family)
VDNISQPGARQGRFLSRLGLSPAPTDLISAGNSGLDVSIFGRLARSLGVSEASLADITGVSQSSLTRRKRSGRMTPEESERILRIAGLVDLAAGIFGDIEVAVAWLKETNLSLGDVSPLEFARSEIGGREVRDLLGRIEYGVYS